MTTLTGIPKSRADGVSLELPAYFELRWSCTATVCAAAMGLDPDRAGIHDRAGFTISLEIIDSYHAFIEARLESLRESRAILSRQPARCAVCVDGEMMHLDVLLADRRVLALTLLPDGRSLYAQSPLLCDAGLTGGSYDPPTINRLAAIPHAIAAAS